MTPHGTTAALLSDPPRAILTGGSGFLGGHLGRDLRRNGWRVTAVVTPRSSPSRVAALQACGCETCVAPQDAAGWIELVHRVRPDVVFHLATLFRGEHSAQDIEPLVAANITLGAHLLEGLRTAGGGAIVLAGSAWEHHENRPYSPVSLYAATKGALDALLAWYVEVAGIRAVTLDLSDMYGPDDPRRKLLTVLLEGAESGSRVQLNGGEPFIDLLHVRDAAQAFVTASTRVRQLPAGSRERWSVRGDAPRTLRELAAIVERVAGRAINVEWGIRAYRAREAFVPWTSGVRLPNWAPMTMLDDGIRELWRQRGTA